MENILKNLIWIIYLPFFVNYLKAKMNLHKIIKIKWNYNLKLKTI